MDHISSLDNINSPEDLKQLSVKELTALANETRQFIISTLASHPGHLASSLGTVELTLALHYIFNAPDDKLVFDVGHQSYTHKIITGRRDQFPTIRTYGGLSGFPRMDESEYDAFGTGHSSTSISAALGMAMASKIQGDTTRQHIAIIGDGSMTGGEAFEALNNAGVSKANILVVLNDNGISIDKAVGGLSRYLTKISVSRRYNRLKESVWKKVGGNDSDPRRLHRRVGFFRWLTFLVRSVFTGGPNVFESLGFRYFGPIDGHDMEQLVEVLSKVKKLKGPRLLHVVTTKGKGLASAEKNPVVYHAPGRFDADTGQRISQDQKILRYQDVFGHTIVELARENPAIVGITPAMPSGCSLNIMMREMPDRAFDVGIAEQHAMTFAAGMAAQKMMPFCNIYSSFAQRAYDQIIHDVALQHLDMVICLDRAGLVGDDGATHHGAFDLAFLRPIPGLTICSPIDEHELRNMMYTAQLDGKGPVVIRYPRGLSVNADWHSDFVELPIGKGRCLREGTEVAILSIGHIGNNAIKAAQRLSDEGVSTAVFDMRFVKPIDKDLLDTIAASHYRKVITVEDGVRQGGMGSAVVEYFAETRQSVRVAVLGLPDMFVAHGSVSQLQKDCGIDVESIVEEAKRM